MSAVPDTSLGRRTIGEILLEHGFVTKEQVDEATAAQAESGRPLGQILVEIGTITRLELSGALAEQWSDSGAPISPPVGMTLSGTGPALERPEPSAPAGAPTQDQSELLSRLELIENELEMLSSVKTEIEKLSAADGEDRMAPLRAAVEELAGRLSVTEPAIEEIGRRLEFLVVEPKDDARLDEVTSVVAELQEGLATLSQGIDTAAESSQQVATDAAAALASIKEQVREEVAALSAQISGLAEGRDVEQLRALVDALSQRPARDPDLVAQIEDLQAVVEALGDRPTRDDDLVAQIEDLQAVVQALSDRPARDQELLIQVDTLAMRMVELGDRVDVLAAGVQSFSGDADALHELQGALAELTQRPLADPADARRVDELAAAIEELTERPVFDPAVDRRLDELVAAVDELARRPVADPAAEKRVDELAATLDDLRASVDAIVATPAGDPAQDEKLWDIAARLEELERADMLEELRARVVELAERPPVDPALVQRLGELERKLDDVPGDDVLERLDADGRTLGFRIDGVVARIDEMVSSAEEASGSQVSREAWDEARALITSRLEVEAELNARLEQLEERLAQVSENGNGAASAPGTALPDPALQEQLAKMTKRMDQLAATVSNVAQGGGGEGGEGAVEAAAGGIASHAALERDVEKVLMAIERLSVHLGAHERALTELMGAGGVVAQVRELAARVGDLETYGGGASGDSSGGGGAEMRSELRALMRRLEDAEAAQKSDRERVIDQLEKAAGAIDWRLQRLEAVRSDEPGS
jgi:hypothetical protein